MKLIDELGYSVFNGSDPVPGRAILNLEQQKMIRQIRDDYYEGVVLFKDSSITLIAKG